MIENKDNLIIDAAHTVFLRYGYKRVTMSDIAEAAGISRPAIYLQFANKEQIFKAVIRKMNLQSLEAIRHGLPRHASVKEKLLFAFDLWTIKPFTTIQQSPEASQLIHCAYEFARDVLNESGSAFETIITQIIEPAIKTSERELLPAHRIARMMRGAVIGFKELSQTTDELRAAIHEFINLTMKLMK